MVIVPKKFGKQNSAYRHLNMKGAFGNEGALRFLSLAVVISHRITARDEAKGERGRKSERGKEEHLKRRYLETAGLDESDDPLVFHAGIYHQHPEIADG